MGQNRRTSLLIPCPQRTMELGSSEGRGMGWIPSPQRGMSTQGGVLEGPDLLPQPGFSGPRPVGSD